jgi:hypothetical protein
MRWLVLQQKSAEAEEARERRSAQVKEKLLAFYGRVNREKQSAVAVKALMDAYDGRWDDLNLQMEKKYGQSPQL